MTETRTEKSFQIKVKRKNDIRQLRKFKQRNQNYNFTRGVKNESKKDNKIARSNR